MKKIVWLLLGYCAHFTISSAQTGVLDNRLVGLDKQVAALLIDYHAAGVAIAIIENGEITYSEGFGYRDFEQKLPVDGNTVFGIGSVTKSFTASLLGILEDKGHLSLSDKPSKYIPTLRFYHPAMDHAIQIKNLLTHSTGIPSYDSECSSVIFQSTDKAALIPRLAHLKPTAQVGERFMYVNYMYTIAGIIGERITGKSWANNLSSMVLEPLQMKNTYADYHQAKHAANFSLAYAVDKNKPVEILPEAIVTRAPAGNIYSTVNDMAKWVKTWINGGRYGDQQIFSTAYRDAAIRPQQIIHGGPQPTKAKQAQFFNYGYGWFNGTYHGYYKVEHSGGVSGYSSNVAFFPTEDLGIIVLTNQNTSGLAFKITDIITHKLLKLDWVEEDAEAPIFGKVIAVVPPHTPTLIDTKRPTTHPLEDFTGKFSHPAFGEVLVSLKEKVLLAKFPYTSFRLNHKAYNTFDTQFIEKVPQVISSAFFVLNFRTDFDGQINSVMINVSGEEDVEFLRVKE